MIYSLPTTIKVLRVLIIHKMADNYVSLKEEKITIRNMNTFTFKVIFTIGIKSNQNNGHLFEIYVFNLTVYEQKVLKINVWM